MFSISWKQIAIPAVCCLALTAGALLLQAQTSLSLSDMWIRFPDGTVQTTAAHNCFNPADPADEMIRVGGVCIDKYEASLWDAPTGGNPIPDAQIDTYCPDNGQPLGNADCEGFYARPVAGVQPAASITWFQAQQALANSGKRLATSAEWQMAVSGTPDSNTDCNVDTGSVANTGVNLSCVSRHGAFDMVGNLWEWVADWGDDATACATWSSTYGDDLSCVGLGEGETNSHFPGALFRGGYFNNGPLAGPFTVEGSGRPSFSSSIIGFRGAR